MSYARVKSDGMVKNDKVMSHEVAQVKIFKFKYVGHSSHICM